MWHDNVETKEDSLTKLAKVNSDATLEPVTFVDPATVISGEAVEKGISYLGDNGEAIVAGIWETTAYAEVFADDGYPEDEFCHVLTGTATLIDNQGNSQSFDAGESYVIKKGWCGEFHVTDGFKKIYVMASE